MIMFKSAIFAFISLTFCFEIDENTFINDELLYPKCCPKGQMYVVVNNTLNCLVNQSDVLVSNEERNNDTLYPCLEVRHGYDNGVLINRTTDDFEDFSQDDYISYPKCCPLGRSYSVARRKCVPDDQNPLNVTEASGIIFKHGLSGCIDDENLFVNVHNFTLDKDMNASSHDGTVFPPGKYCFDYDIDSEAVILRTCNKKEDFCKGTKRCFPKCCRDGQIMINNKCAYDFEQAMNISEVINGSIVEDYLIYHHFERGNDGNPRDLTHFGAINMAENYTLTESGEFTSLESSDYYVSNYCVEFVQNRGTRVFYYLEEFRKVNKIRYVIQPVLFVASIVCLLLTIACYLVLPEMQNLYGKCIVAYCLDLVAMFCIFFYMYTVKVTQGLGCVAVGFIVTYTITSSYAWLNVICFDMWMTFGTMKARSTSRRDWKRFLYYSLYGAFMPGVMILFGVSVYAWEYLPSNWVPNLGVDKCFFSRESGTGDEVVTHYDYFLFYVTPSVILIVINLVLYTKTITYCFKVKSEINKMKDNVANMKEKKKKIFVADKEKMLIFLKLFIIMGLPWVGEVLTSAIDFQANIPLQIIELLLDIINSIQGVFIFCILILKKNIFKSLRRRFCGTPLKDRTQSTTISTTMSSRSLNSSVAHSMHAIGASKTDINSAQ